MGTNVTNEGGISRRSFLGGVAGVGALAAMGLAGCSPKAAGTTGAESASSSASAATGVADNNAVAVDDGSAAITVDWLGAPPEMIEGIAGGTLIMNGGYKVLSRDEIVQILKESM